MKLTMCILAAGLVVPPLAIAQNLTTSTVTMGAKIDDNSAYLQTPMSYEEVRAKIDEANREINNRDSAVITFTEQMTQEKQSWILQKNEYTELLIQYTAQGIIPKPIDKPPDIPVLP